MKLLRSFPAVALAVVLLAIVGFFTADRSVGLLLVAGVLAVLSWYVTEGPRGRALPTWVSNVLIVAVWLNFAAELLQRGLDIVAAMGQLIVWMTVIKLYQRKAPRDYAQLLTLSVLLVILGCVRSTDLLFAVVLVLYAGAALYALLLYQLYAAHERSRLARAAELPPGQRLAGATQPIIGRRPALHFRGLMAAIAAAGLTTSTLLFLLFPRQLGRAVDAAGRGGPAVSGVSEELTLTASTRISASRRVVMTVAVEGGALAGGQPLRLRGAVLDRYDGDGRWRVDPAHAMRTVNTDQFGFTPLARDLPPPRRPITQHVEVLAPSRSVYAAYVPVGITTPQTGSFRLDTRTQTLRYAGTGRLRSYAVRSDREPTDAMIRTLRRSAGAPIDSEGMRAIRGRVGDLARDLLRGRAMPAEPPGAPAERDEFRAAAARIFTDYLRSGLFTYTTDLRDVVLSPNQDPIVQFLFETHRGHCEYYASALAAMCNAIGVPARVVTGFVALEYDEGAGHYIVRAANAHAWVEVQTGPDRWSTYDPTPPATLHELHAAKNTLTDRLRWVFDRLEAAWHNEFIAFDRASQTELLSRLDFDWTRHLGDLAQATLRWMARLNRRFYLGPAGYIWMGLVAAVALVALVAAGRHLRRTSRLRRAVRLPRAADAAQRRMLRQLGFYLDMLAALRRGGRPKPAWQPPLAYAETLARRHPEAAGIIRRIARRFYAARYGGRPLRREELAEMHALVGRLGGAMRAGPRLPVTGHD